MNSDDGENIADDVRTLYRLGHAQELSRRMSGFSKVNHVGIGVTTLLTDFSALGA